MHALVNQFYYLHFMKIKLIAAILVIFACSSCTKKIEKRNFRFEIVTTTPISEPVSILMGIGTGIRKTSGFISGTKWTYDYMLETGKLPIELYLNAKTMYLDQAGSATFKIYVNDKEKSSEVVQSTMMGSQIIIAPTVLGHTIQ